MTFLLSCAIKTSIIVAIALVIARLLPGKSAAVRHWILTAAVFCALAAPLASLVLPTWNAGRVIVSSGTIPSSIEKVSDAVAGTAAKPTRNPVGLPGQLVPWIWLSGLSLGLLTLLIGSIRLARLSAFSGQDVGKLWTVAADEISNLYGLRRRIQLLRSRNSAILVTWGVFRPKILLPAGSWEWPEERIRAVLCHEISHIRRGDWWIQTTAELLRAVYWFNPLIWILCQRLRMESEYACDDAVLAQGITGPEYAAQLLDIVCLLQVTDRPWSSALGMASPSTIERRFAAMLNPHVNRRSVSRFAMLVTALAGLGVTLPLAALSTAARVQAQTHEPMAATPNTALTSGQSALLQIPAVRRPSPETSKSGTQVAVSVAQPVQPQVSATAAPTPSPQQTQYKGEIVSFDVKNLSLSEFFKLIGVTSGLEIVTDPSINNVEPFNLRLRDVPWDQALNIVLVQNRLIGQLEGNVLRIRQAPAPAQESITMEFEMYKNGSMLGAPRITTAVAHAATVEQGSEAASANNLKITATPSRTVEGKIQIVLEIFVGNSGMRDVLIVSNGEQRSISWRSSSGESMEARITASVKK